MDKNISEQFMHYVRCDATSTSKVRSHFRRITRRSPSNNSTASNLICCVDENQIRHRVPSCKIRCNKCEKLNLTKNRRINQT